MGLETKDRILDVAERLFANCGFAATSLRDITSEAGVNLAAVNYHFGSKEELLAATMERRLRPINDQRIQMLNALEAPGRHHTHHDVVRAFLIPFFEKHKEWGEKAHEFRLLSGRVHYEMHEDFRNNMLRPFDHVIERFVDAFLRTLPHLSRREIRLRLLFLTGAMAYSLTWGVRLEVWGIDGLVDPEEMLDDLLVFSATAMASSSGHALRTATNVGTMTPRAPAVVPRANRQ